AVRHLHPEAAQPRYQRLYAGLGCADLRRPLHAAVARAYEDQRRRRQLQSGPHQRCQARPDDRPAEGRDRHQEARCGAQAGARDHPRPGLLRAVAPPGAAVGNEERRHDRLQPGRSAASPLRYGEVRRKSSYVIFRQLWEHDLAWSFRRSPVTVVAAALTFICVGAALLAPWISPQDPFNMGALNLNEAFAPPAWDEKGLAQYPLGTDNQGRDILSTI